MGYCGLARMFFTEFLPHEERVLWLDTDTVVNGDICQLWLHFERFNATQIIGYPGAHAALPLVYIFAAAENMLRTVADLPFPPIGAQPGLDISLQ